MFTSLTSLELAGCLGQVEEVELKGLTLLRQLRPLSGNWFPDVPPAILTEATTEIIDYTKACAATAAKLQALPPVLLPGLPCPEYGL
jgi:hypothetical protein